MPTEKCDDSHLCRRSNCRVRMHGTCGVVDEDNNPDFNEMLRVCGRAECSSGKDECSSGKSVVVSASPGSSCEPNPLDNDIC